MCLVAIQWLVFGYSLAFGKGSAIIGGFEYAGTIDVNGEPDLVYAPTIPKLAFWWFQLTFAMITPALISGSVIGRIRLRCWVIFTLVWTTVVYDAIAHWSWSAWEEDGNLRMPCVIHAVNRHPVKERHTHN